MSFRIVLFVRHLGDKSRSTHGNSHVPILIHRIRSIATNCLVIDPPSRWQRLDNAIARQLNDSACVSRHVGRKKKRQRHVFRERVVTRVTRVIVTSIDIEILAALVLYKWISPRKRLSGQYVAVMWNPHIDVYLPPGENNAYAESREFRINRMTMKDIR